jgi:hypothetical protein
VIKASDMICHAGIKFAPGSHDALEKWGGRKGGERDRDREQGGKEDVSVGMLRAWRDVLRGRDVTVFEEREMTRFRLQERESERERGERTLHQASSIGGGGGGGSGHPGGDNGDMELEAMREELVCLVGDSAVGVVTVMCV